MKKVGIFQNEKAMHAIYIGLLCSISYLAVYFARNILGAVTPQMIEEGFAEEYIGKASSVYFVFYAVGQLINGAIGDKIKARYMISGGLLLAGVTNVIFSRLAGDHPNIALAVYGMTGFFLAMIYGPMTKVVSENTDPLCTHRCSLGYTFSSFFGSPLAGMAASLFIWQSVFVFSSSALGVMAVICFFGFLIMEKKGIVVYGRYQLKQQEKGGIRVLLEREIVKFALISIITGVIRTTVVFWMPTYFSQYLGFSSEQSALIFTASTFIISFTTFIAIFVYERLGRKMNVTLLVMFSAATVLFGLLYVVKMPWVNIVLMVLAIMASNAAATMLWSVYCPSLYNTGMVSTATGFLDFVSYMAAAASSSLFASAATTIGWGNLILVWGALMLFGVVVCLPYNKWIKKSK